MAINYRPGPTTKGVLGGATISTAIVAPSTLLANGSEMEALKELNQKLTTQKEELIGDIDSLRWRNQGIEHVMRDKIDSNKELNKQLAKVNEELGQQRERNELVKSLAETQQDTIEEQRSKIEEQTEVGHGLQRQNQVLGRALREATEEIQTLKAKANGQNELIMGMQENIEQANKLNEQLKAQSLRALGQNAILSSHLHAVTEENEQKAAQIQTLVQQLEQQSDEAQEAKDDLTLATQENNQLQQKSKQLEVELRITKERARWTSCVTNPTMAAGYKLTSEGIGCYWNDNGITYWNWVKPGHPSYNSMQIQYNQRIGSSTHSSESLIR